MYNTSDTMIMCLGNKSNASCHQTEHSQPSGAIGNYIFRCILSIAIIVLHSLKIATVVKTRSLKTVSNFFKCGLSFGGMVLGLSVILHAIMDITGKLNQAKVCLIFLLITATVAGVTMSNVLLIYIEAFIVTHYTMMNRQVFSKTCAIGLLGATWLLWGLIGLLKATKFPYETTVISSDICHLNNGQVSKTDLQIVCGLIIAHIVILIILQVAIYLRIRAHANKFNVKIELPPDNKASNGTLSATPSGSILDTPRSISNEVFTMTTPKHNNITHFEFTDIRNEAVVPANVKADILNDQNTESIPLAELNKSTVHSISLVELHVEANTSILDGEVETLANSIKEKNTQIELNAETSQHSEGTDEIVLILNKLKGEANLSTIPNMETKTLSDLNMETNFFANPSVNGNSLEIPNVQANSFEGPDILANPNGDFHNANIVSNVAVKEDLIISESNVDIEPIPNSLQKHGKLNMDTALKRHRSSQSNIKIYKIWMLRVSKLVRQMTAILVSFLACYIPFLVLTLIGMNSIQKHERIISFISATAIGINPILNFIVFLTVNGEFRVALIKMLTCKT